MLRLALLCLSASFCDGDESWDRRRDSALEALTAAAKLAPPPETGGVDHSCQTPQRVGKDPCACQLKCSDMHCSNAETLCNTQFKSWCSGMDTNTAKRVEKRVATLKMRGAPWSIEDAALELKGSSRPKMVAIIGEQKCGTTLLYDALVKDNSKMVSAAANGRKEQHFFDSHHVITECRTRAYLAGLNPRGFSGYVVDATPDYLADPVAAVFMAKMFPETRVIALIREPVSRAFAAWDQNRRAGSEGRDFLAAVQDELPTAKRCSQLAGTLAEVSSNATRSHALIEYVERCLLFIGGRPRNCWVNHEYSSRPACKRYLQKGLYGDHLAAWTAVFPAQQIGVLRSERLFEDKQAAVDSVLAFLGRTGPARQQDQPQQTCWHDCGQAKKTFDAEAIPADVRSQLEDLYRPAQVRLEGLLQQGKLTLL